MAPAMQQPKSDISTPLPWILKIRAIEGLSLVQNHMRHVRSESAREQRTALYNNNNNNNNNDDDNNNNDDDDDDVLR